MLTTIIFPGRNVQGANALSLPMKYLVVNAVIRK